MRPRKGCLFGLSQLARADCANAPAKNAVWWIFRVRLVFVPVCCWCLGGVSGGFATGATGNSISPLRSLVAGRPAETRVVLVVAATTAAAAAFTHKTHAHVCVCVCGINR